MSDSLIQNDNTVLSQKDLEAEKTICKQFEDKDIEELDDMAFSSMKTILRKRIEMGMVFLALKNRLPHGTFQKHIEETFKEMISPRLARDAMRHAREAHNYLDMLEKENISINKFNALLKLNEEIFSKALEEDELNGKSIGKITNDELQNILAKQEARDREISILNTELNKSREKEKELKNKIKKGVEQIEETENLIEELKTNSDKKYKEQLRQVIDLISDAVYTIEMIQAINLKTKDASPLLSEITVAVSNLKESWENGL